MKKNLTISTISLILSAIALFASCVGLFNVLKAKRNIEANTTTTTVVEQERTTAKAEHENETVLSVKEELDKFRNDKHVIDVEAYNYLEIVPYLEEMSPTLLKLLDSTSFKCSKLREYAKEELSPEAYKELQNWIENDSEWWTPTVTVTEGYTLQYSPEHDVNISYSNGKFVLAEEYWRYSVWTENVEVPSNNEDAESERTYIVQNPSKPAYILIESAETPLQLYIIEPENN